jgi:hypothetical protein
VIKRIRTKYVPAHMLPLLNLFRKQFRAIKICLGFQRRVVMTRCNLGFLWPSGETTNPIEHINSLRFFNERPSDSLFFVRQPNNQMINQKYITKTPALRRGLKETNSRMFDYGLAFEVRGRDDFRWVIRPERLQRNRCRHSNE